MKQGLKGMVLAAGIALMIPSQVLAGYEITQSQTGMHGATTSKIFISKNKYMVIQPESRMSINFATQRISMTNEDQKTYWEGTVDEYLRTLQDVQNASMARMKEMLQKLPESQRKEIMAIHGIDTGKPVIRVTVKRTGKTETIAGYKAEQYSVNNNGEPFEELWLAKGLNIGAEIGPEKLQVFLAKLKKTTMGGATQAGIALSKAYLNLSRQGYPLKQVFEKTMMTVTADSVKKASIPDAVFQVPAGYARVKSLKMFLMSRENSMRMKMQ